MGIFGSLFGGIPILYRYLGKEFLKNLLLVLLTSLLLAVFVSSMVFLNFAKELSPKLLLEYSTTSAAVYTPLLLPVLELVAVGLTLYPFIERRLNWIVFSAGIAPRNFLKPFAVLSLIPTLLLAFHFELIYPRAGYIQHLDYLKAKNKPLRKGIVEDFWYKSRKGEFLYFSLVHLSSEKAFDGRLFKVDRNYQLEWVTYIPRATFEVREGKIKVFARDVKRYTPEGVKTLSQLRLEFPYESKLLKVKNPAFFSTSELIRLVSFAREVGINYYPYLWELIKRLLVLVMALLVPVVGGVYTFASIKREEFVEKILQFFLSLLAFYVALLLFQTLVLKISLNPLYGLLLLVPHTLWGIALIGKKKS